MDENILRPYRIGALMYVPALHKGVEKKLCGASYPGLNTLAFCLEDAVMENAVEEAEAQLLQTLTYVEAHRGRNLPLLFVRVRSCRQLSRLPALLGKLSGLLTGVILPKFDLTNAAEYCSILGKINSRREVPLYVMPILESFSLMQLSKRERSLLSLRELLDGCREYVLNIRVGAMDFCKPYGLRRSVHQTIYDIITVREVLTDILTVFSDEYVVSAPVWEYFAGAGSNGDWAVGLEKELQLDVANGFIGKTIIHPSQIPYVQKWLQPTGTDVRDARMVLDWEGGTFGVAKSAGGNRMNERATHQKWARKVLILAEIYGERDAENKEPV